MAKLGETGANIWEIRDMISQFRIAAERLTAKGYGKSQLLDPDHPEDGVNRRVQVINTSASSEPGCPGRRNLFGRTTFAPSMIR